MCLGFVPKLNVAGLVSHPILPFPDPDFIEHTQPVLDPLFKSVTPPHLILSTATIPETLATYVQQHHPQTTRLITPNLHRLPHNLAVSKVTWSGGNWKADVLLELRRSFVEDARDGRVDTQAIIFINKNIKADYMGEYLTEHGIKNLVMTADSPMRGRGSNRHLAGFLASPTATQKAKIKPVDQASAPVPWNKPEAPPRVLVTTGMLSRGLDFAPTISTVVMCDEPRNAVDFIHRAGRGGRAGHKGRVVIFTKENLKPVIRHGGGAGRGGAIYKTVSPSGHGISHDLLDPCALADRCCDSRLFASFRSRSSRPVSDFRTRPVARRARASAPGPRRGPSSRSRGVRVESRVFFFSPVIPLVLSILLYASICTVLLAWPFSWPRCCTSSSADHSPTRS